VPEYLSHNPGLPHQLGCDRLHDRYEWRHWVQVCWFRQGSISSPIVVSTTDLSAGGIGLLCPNMVHPGTVGVVMLVDAQYHAHLRYIQVMHCRYLIGSMSHLIGGQWIPEPMDIPNMEIELTGEGPRLSIGQPLSRRDLGRRRRAAAAARANAMRSSGGWGRNHVNG